MLLACDSATTKATVGGNSLKKLMDQFEADLVKAFARERLSPIPAHGLNVGGGKDEKKAQEEAKGETTRSL